VGATLLGTARVVAYSTPSAAMHGSEHRRAGALPQAFTGDSRIEDRDECGLFGKRESIEVRARVAAGGAKRGQSPVPFANRAVRVLCLTCSDRSNVL
jgi:hypothetical protein